MVEAMLDVDDIVVRRGDRPVLDGVSITVGRGECVAVVGPNGAGKSSLVSAIGGDLPLHSGRVAIDGCALGAMDHRARARARAILTQQVTVALGFTVHEVIAMGREPWRGCPEAQADEHHIAGAMEAVDVAHLADRPVQNLSGGEQSRVAIARTLAQSARLLVWDEPTAALDVEHQVSALGAMRRHVTSGGSALLVLHDLTLAAAVADRVVVLAGGQVVAAGTVDQVLTPALIRDVYRAEVECVTTPRGGRALVPVFGDPTSLA